MSEDARKDCRTQGKYRERSQYSEDKRSQKRQDKRLQGSSTVKEPQEKKFHKRKSDGGKTSNTSLTSESESPVRYEENSNHSFSELEKGKKPVEIKTQGKHVLSNTENGESVVYYDDQFFEEDEAYQFMEVLKDTTNWNEKNIVIHGVEVPQPRLVAWYGPFPYTYSGATLEPAEMPDSILKIRERVEDFLKRHGINVTLNSVLLNLYRNGKDSVAWHSDDELSMGVCPTIASVSLGETRKFEMKRKFKAVNGSPSSLGKGDEYFINLTNGSLLIMDGCMQDDWLHRVPKEYHDRCERINLTFRTVYKLEDLPPSPDAYPRSQRCNSNGVLRKSFGNQSDCGVNYDDENFPPLSSSTSPVCSDVKKSPESCVPVGAKISGSHKWRSSDSFYRNKTSLKNSGDITESSDMLDTGDKKRDKIHSSDKVSANERSWKNDRSWKNVPSKAHDRIAVPGNVHYAAALDRKATAKTDDISGEPEEYWDSEPIPNNCVINDEPIDRSGKQVVEPYRVEKSTILNNLNEGRKNVKIDMQNKNLHAYDSDFSGNNVQGSRANTRKDQNFRRKESYDALTNSVDNVQENAHKVQNETTFGKNREWTPNVEAKEFVPLVHAPAPNFPYDYTPFNLESLLDYKVHLMTGNQLRNYAFALRDKVLEKIDDFIPPYQEELDVLCALTDADQTEKNLKILSSRMPVIVRRALNHEMSPSYRKSYGNPRRPNHGNQNHYAGRKYSSNIRERPFRQA